MKKINFNSLISQILIETDEVDSKELFGVVTQMKFDGYDDETIEETLKELLRKLKSIK